MDRKTAINVVVGKRLRKVRKALDIPVEELAEIMELSEGHLRKLERGDNAVSLSCLCVLHDKFGVDLNYLVAGKSREQDLARVIMTAPPEKIFYFMRQLVDACQQVYINSVQHGEEDFD